jgi:hypothetical protein
MAWRQEASPLACPSRNGIWSLFISRAKRTYSSHVHLWLCFLGLDASCNCLLSVSRINQVERGSCMPRPAKGASLSLELEKGGPKGFQIRYVSTSHFRMCNWLYPLIFSFLDNATNHKQLSRAPKYISFQVTCWHVAMVLAAYCYSIFVDSILR